MYNTSTDLALFYPKTFSEKFYATPVALSIEGNMWNDVNEGRAHTFVY